MNAALPTIIFGLEVAGLIASVVTFVAGAWSAAVGGMCIAGSLLLQRHLDHLTATVPTAPATPPAAPKV